MSEPGPLGGSEECHEHQYLLPCVSCAENSEILYLMCKFLWLISIVGWIKNIYYGFFYIIMVVNLTRVIVVLQKVKFLLRAS